MHKFQQLYINNVQIPTNKNDFTINQHLTLNKFADYFQEEFPKSFKISLYFQKIPQIRTLFNMKLQKKRTMQKKLYVQKKIRCNQSNFKVKRKKYAVTKNYDPVTRFHYMFSSQSLVQNEMMAQRCFRL
eukprot:TRINITY_DN39152_c0_g1_i1.p3 TRINITY_DN39152_c0_g1~~TRINITY_DN39152_c0_g1_i1.p3  ORF type:complete len:129 (+),score=3.55 TRINITY_DN39152_c0_g1_i1:372-758(+)